MRIIDNNELTMEKVDKLPQLLFIDFLEHGRETAEHTLEKYKSQTTFLNTITDQKCKDISLRLSFIYWLCLVVGFWPVILKVFSDKSSEDIKPDITVFNKVMLLMGFTGFCALVVFDSISHRRYQAGRVLAAIKLKNLLDNNDLVNLIIPYVIDKNKIILNGLHKINDKSEIVISQISSMYMVKAKLYASNKKEYLIVRRKKNVKKWSKIFGAKNGSLNEKIDYINYLLTCLSLFSMLAPKCDDISIEFKSLSESLLQDIPALVTKASLYELVNCRFSNSMRDSLQALFNEVHTKCNAVDTNAQSKILNILYLMQIYREKNKLDVLESAVAKIVEYYSNDNVTIEIAKLEPEDKIRKIIELNLGDDWGTFSDIILDPISYNTILNPMLSLSGHSYEKEHIYKWLTSSNDKSKSCIEPLTGKELYISSMKVNRNFTVLINYLLLGGKLRDFPGFIDSNTRSVIKEPVIIFDDSLVEEEYAKKNKLPYTPDFVMKKLIAEFCTAPIQKPPVMHNLALRFGHA